MEEYSGTYTKKLPSFGRTAFSVGAHYSSLVPLMMSSNCRPRVWAALRQRTMRSMKIFEVLHHRADLGVDGQVEDQQLPLGSICRREFSTA